MSINNTIFHTYEAIVVIRGNEDTVTVQAKSVKDARRRLQRQYNTKQVTNIKKVS